MPHRRTGNILSRRATCTCFAKATRNGALTVDVVDAHAHSDPASKLVADQIA
jgi:hypothetical protein